MKERQVTAFSLAMDIDRNKEVSLDELTLSQDRFKSLCVLPESLDQFEFVTHADANNDGVVSLSEQAAALGEL
jgi:hypothetical protein